MPRKAEKFDPAAFAAQSGQALIKRINALAEEAGGIVEGAGLAFGTPEAVLEAARRAGLPPAVQDRLSDILTEIATLKALLKRREAGR